MERPEIDATFVLCTDLPPSMKQHRAILVLPDFRELRPGLSVTIMGVRYFVDDEATMAYRIKLHQLT